jgi:hypothetical protein
MSVWESGALWSFWFSEHIKKNIKNISPELLLYLPAILSWYSLSLSLLEFMDLSFSFESSQRHSLWYYTRMNVFISLSFLCGDGNSFLSYFLSMLSIPDDPLWGFVIVFQENTDLSKLPWFVLMITHFLVEWHHLFFISPPDSINLWQSKFFIICILWTKSLYSFPALLHGLSREARPPWRCSKGKYIPNSVVEEGCSHTKTTYSSELFALFAFLVFEEVG